MNKKTIGFIGGGNMASAIIGGILAAGLADADHIFASSKTDATAQHLADSFGIHTGTDNAVRHPVSCRKTKYVCLSHSTDP